MRSHVHHFHYCEGNAQLQAAVQTLIHKVTQMTKSIDDFVAEAAVLKTSVDNAVAFIATVPALTAAAVQKALQDAGVDSAATDAAVQAATQSMQTEVDALNAAVASSQATPPADSTPPADATPPSA